MSLFGGLEGMQKRSFNMQFGGGCPICKTRESLALSDSAEGEVVCGSCGAVFRRSPTSREDFLRGDICLELIAGDRYLNKAFPLRAWRLIGILPEDDSLLLFYKDKSAYFYATDLGLVREAGKVDYLLYEDIDDLSVSDVWSFGLVRIFLVSILLFSGLGSLALSFSMSALGGYLASFIALALGGLVVFFSRKQAFQFRSGILSKKEIRAWRIYDVSSPEARDFVSFIRSKIKNQ